jgi:hypothetical protein
LIKKHTAIILLIFAAIAIIHGFIIFPSLNIFFSWLLIGLWVVFTIKVFQKRKEYNDYNSQKNTSFFIICPLGVGLFYNFWGYFTGLLGDDLLEDAIPSLYVSWWTIIFALPYILYGIIILRACYTKYDVIYIIRTRSINARKFVIAYSIFILIGVITYIISFNVILYYFFIIVERSYYYEFDIILLFFCLILIFLFVRHALIGSARAVPEVSADFLARRRKRLEGITAAPVRATRKRAPTPTPARPRPRPTTPTPSRPATSRTSSKPSTSKPKATQVSRPTASRQRAVARPSYDKLMPKAGILSLEDFKCIFCFQLPSVPADERRGIILCPNCRHPAHADEFKDWTKASPLCSRCDASIPPSFRRNPKVIPIKTYLHT